MPYFRGLELFRYRLDLLKPIYHKENKITYREGYLLKLKVGEKAVFGEAAPLPFFHQETMASCLLEMRYLKENIEKIRIRPQKDFCLKKPFLGMFSLEKGFSGCSMWAIEGALFQIYRPFFSSYKISLSQLYYLEDLLRLRKAPRGAIKVKLNGSDEKEVEAFLGFLREQKEGDLQMKVDANQSFSKEGFLAFTEKLPEKSALYYLEEPTKEKLEHANVPIALDESLWEIEPEDFRPDTFVKALSIKPSKMGGLSKAAGWIECAAKYGLEISLSSAYESGMSLLLYAHLAREYKIDQEKMGLGGYRFLKQDIFYQKMDLNKEKVKTPMMPKDIHFSLLERVL